MKKEYVDDDCSSDNMLIIDDAPLPNSKSKSTVLTPSTSGNVNNSTTSNSNKKRKKRDSASSDEERWLTAIESGKLEDVDDELKKIKPKDPAMMTARQRAMYDRGGAAIGDSCQPLQLMSLPTGYKEKVMTAEAIMKAAIKSQKRKQMADEKREKDKKKTMDRLLKKQETKSTKQTKIRPTRSLLPTITYRQTSDLSTLSFPANANFTLYAMTDVKVPIRIYCAMKCGNLKKYSCSKTDIPLCSLECYQKNLSNIS